ncbi:hypothetical protein KM043_008866 [Ampulex compressa]|nr:hypothetical protein KM043_008866 [Ampulex compressa]
MEVTIITWGASVVSLKCPDKYGHPLDVVLGFDDLKDYMDPVLNPFIGCVLGRCANRIKDGYICIGNKSYQLTTNVLGNMHHLHGGINGFGRRIWESYMDGCSVVMSYLSHDGEEGYPGAVLATIRFQLTVDNKLEISCRATTTKPTIVNMSHGSMFNLAGHDAGEAELRNHRVLLNCDRWTFADYPDMIPTGAIRGVSGTIMDFRIPKLLGEYLEKISPIGYDHNFCVTQSSQMDSTFVAKVLHKKSGRILEVYSDQPGVHLYTGGYLVRSNLTQSYDQELASSHSSEDYEIKNTTEEDCVSYSSYGEGEKAKQLSTKFIPDCIRGKGGVCYKNYAAFSIQPQNYPNATNYSHFPCTILYPGEIYRHDLIYKFGIQLANYM